MMRKHKTGFVNSEKELERTQGRAGQRGWEWLLHGG